MRGGEALVRQRGELTPSQVVVVDDSTRYGEQLCNMVTLVLGRGRGDHDRAKCISHHWALGASERWWGVYRVALVDARDAHCDPTGIPVAAGDVVRRISAFSCLHRIVVYSANFDNPYLNRYVREDAPAAAYYDAAALLRDDGFALRSALLDEEPVGQMEPPALSELVDLGQGADLASAISGLRREPEAWRWVLGLTPWKAVDSYRQRKVRDIARNSLKMRPPARPLKVRDGREITDRNPDSRVIRSVLRAALGFPRE